MQNLTLFTKKEGNWFSNIEWFICYLQFELAFYVEWL